MHEKCIAMIFLSIIIAAESKHKIPIKIIVLKQIKHYPASCAIIPSLMWKIVIRIHSFIHNHSSLSKIAQRGFIKRRFINYETKCDTLLLYSFLAFYWRHKWHGFATEETIKGTL